MRTARGSVCRAIGRRFDGVAQAEGSNSRGRRARLGDPSRNIPPGAACHRPGSGGPIETPILSENGREYIVLQLKMYASGQRQNDVYGRMRTIAAKFKPNEIDGLAICYRADSGDWNLISAAQFE